ncbi:MAG: hypothetical protein ACE5E6_06925 [Phycisphaerae bacterium]
MLDFRRINTPSRHGDTLVLPEPRGLVAAVRANGQALGRCDVPLLDETLAAWRRRTREQVAGTDDAPVIVVGHQPAFIHPGVWAKHIVAVRLAEALGGVAVNLIVDCDAPKTTTVAVPYIRDATPGVRAVPFAALPPGGAYEQIARQGSDELAAFQANVRDAMAERFDASQMPAFHDALRNAADAGDWVDQAVVARQAVEARFGVAMRERRVSRLSCSPLLVDMLLGADRFSACYNRALDAYREAQRLRGTRHPMPDLVRGDRRWEVPVWAYQATGPRRRVFVERSGDTARLFADTLEIGQLDPALAATSAAAANWDGVARGWRLRPRALTLTIWARLLLADLFVHGIGGAKYDRIADRIIADYYRVTPPDMACVSATLTLGLPHRPATAETVRIARHALRDLQYNPQRHVPDHPDLVPLLRRRAAAVAQSQALRRECPGDRQRRRAAFLDIRDANAAMLAARPELLTTRRAALDRSIRDLAAARIAAGREYFFGLFTHDRLQVLFDALPNKRDFRV